MARKEFIVDELVEVLHQLHKGRSITQIKHSVGMDHKTIRKYTGTLLKHRKRRIVSKNRNKASHNIFSRLLQIP